jgi:hypothetical protein
VIQRDPCHSCAKCTRLYDEQVPVANFRQRGAELIRFTKRGDCVGGHFAIDGKYLMPELGYADLANEPAICVCKLPDS